ncbi:hypothetical protein [Saccharibacillus brassicae]|uniref:Uncharacterized protein n=1 Tax=Saccharibacillus brassicae TaxID=2583377 RepID=A0A4Y6V326_SACBS|nr:hypothetical protein [Saccharibacillus brassicae]QDH23218.1 hypothetical protein FFV09_21555 [Saccharibacillus brassicae]
MTLYQKLLNIQAELSEVAAWADFYQAQPHEGNRDAARQAYRDFASWLERFTRPQLILIYACAQIGDTGMGKRFDSEATGHYNSSPYPLPLYESAERLLERYAAFNAFWSRDKLSRYLCRCTSDGKPFEFGMSILQKAPNRTSGSAAPLFDREPDPVRQALEAEEPPEFTTSSTLIVSMDNSDCLYTYYEFREDAALCIEWLHTRFYDWMYGQKGIHPFRWHHEHLHKGRRTFEGWGYIQGPDDFVDWINTFVYLEPVGRPLPICPLVPPIAKLSF